MRIRGVTLSDTQKNAVRIEKTDCLRRGNMPIKHPSDYRHVGSLCADGVLPAIKDGLRAACCAFLQLKPSSDC